MSNSSPVSDREELEILKKTFEEFIATSSQLQQSYEQLKDESQRLSLYLSNILDNMSSAVMVFDNRFSLNLWNGETHGYFPFLKDKRPPVAMDQLSANSTIDLKGLLKSNTRLKEMEVEIEGVRMWLEVSASDFMNARREKTGYLVVIDDKTELKKLQLKSQQEDRLRVMGELAAEVAHEIRNPLGSIELMVTMLQEDLQQDEHHGEVLSRIRTSVNNMNHIVTNILLYTRELHPDRSEFTVAELIDQTQSMALDTIHKKQIEVEKHLVNMTLNADFELLKQSIANVLINAAQAVPFKGRIHIQTRLEKDKVTLLIKDNGPGIPEEIQANIFKPFFTTKNTGTGLGLAMVKRVIESHSGHIYFESTAKGTTFFIELPLNS